MNIPTSLGQYDSDLQMFVEEPRDIDADHIQSIRWAWRNAYYTLDRRYDLVSEHENVLTR